MSKSGFFNKKFILITLSILVIIAIVVGFIFLFRPKVDLNAPYDDTYSLVNNEDFNYVVEQNENIYQIINTLTDASSESYGTIKQSFYDINTINSIILQQKQFLLENLLFTEDKDNNMLELQKNISKKRDELSQNIEDCKAYIDQYLTNSAVEIYPNDDATFNYIVNYYDYYTTFSLNLTSYFKLISDVFDNYLIDTFTVNPLSKANLKSLMYWAEKICDNYVNSDIEKNALTQATSHVVDFENSLVLDDATYFENTAYYDELLSNFDVLSFNDIIDNLAKNTFDEYIASLQGEQNTSAYALKNNFYFV